ncbi:hypothetical protein DNTS_021534 [Danionella cerebrum]|uniref:Uncharacterized protein n=1 Tax=Danionella cerebrum TaxID=2873325 RepID=A0A553QIB0_9TELE|nr:hypothetical protein DNTS_021534 [Danionella translucida]
MEQVHTSFVSLQGTLHLPSLVTDDGVVWHASGKAIDCIVITRRGRDPPHKLYNLLPHLEETPTSGLMQSFILSSASDSCLHQKDSRLYSYLTGSVSSPQLFNLLPQLQGQTAAPAASSSICNDRRRFRVTGDNHPYLQPSISLPVYPSTPIRTFMHDLCIYPSANWSSSPSFHLLLVALPIHPPIGQSPPFSLPRHYIHTFITLSIHPLTDLPPHPSIHPSICPSIHPSLCPSIFQLIFLPFHLSIHPSIDPSVTLSIHPSTGPPPHPSIHYSVHPSFNCSSSPSFHLSIHPSAGHSSIHPSLCPRGTLSSHLIFLSIHPSIRPPVPPSLHPCVTKHGALYNSLSFFIAQSSD